MRTPFGALGAVAVLGLVFACGDSNDGTSDGTGDGGTTNPDGSGPGTNPDGSDNQPNPDGGVSPSFVPFDINHVIFTGQSNETGNDARPPLSLTQPYGNLAFDTGPMSMTGGYSYNPVTLRRLTPIAGCDDYGCRTAQALTAFKPLVEGDAYFDNSFAGGDSPYAVETPASGLANEISKVATTTYGLAKHDVLASVDGRSGNGYACIRKGGAGCTDHYGDNYGSVRGDDGYLNSFKQSMAEVTAAKALATAANKSYVVRGIAAVHGEQDSDDYFYGSSIFPLVGSDGTAGALKSYTDALLEWQRDFEGGVKAITAQTQPVPLFVVQISNWGEAIRDDPSRVASRVPQMQLDAHTKAPGKVVVIGAGYPLEINQEDCLHFTSEGTRRLGEYFGKVYTEVVIAGRTWEPVRPKLITRNGTTITVQYFVPRPPLAIDTTQVAEAPGRGFTVVDGNGNALATVTDAKVTAPDTVTLTLSGDPGAGARLRYALNQDVLGGCAGPQNGARGNVRDSDTTPSQSGGAPLQNWGVHFDLPIP